MELTTEILGRYVGGQAEIQNREAKEPYSFRGEIAEIKLDGDNLVIRFAWVGKMVPFMSGHWVNEPDLDYAVTLKAGSFKLCGVSDIGEGRIFLGCSYIGEATTLFPRGFHSNMEPSRIEGLVLNQS